MQNYPLSIFHASDRLESSPGADLSTLPRSYDFNYFVLIQGPGPFWTTKGSRELPLNFQMSAQRMELVALVPLRLA